MQNYSEPKLIVVEMATVAILCGSYKAGNTGKGPGPQTLKHLKI